jgi:hypothetical protein
VQKQEREDAVRDRDEHRGDEWRVDPLKPLHARDYLSVCRVSEAAH